MKIKILTALCTALLLIRPAFAAEPENKPAPNIPQPNNSDYKWQKVQVQDLYGAWVFNVKKEEGSIFNVTVIRPDQTSYDMARIKLAEPPQTHTTLQKTSWQFDEKTQTIIETTEQFFTEDRLNKTWHATPEHHGRHKQAKVEMMFENGKPVLLIFRNSTNSEATAYVKSRAEALTETFLTQMLKDAETITKTHRTTKK